MRMHASKTLKPPSLLDDFTLFDSSQIYQACDFYKPDPDQEISTNTAQCYLADDQTSFHQMHPNLQLMLDWGRLVEGHDYFGHYIESEVSVRSKNIFSKSEGLVDLLFHEIFAAFGTIRNMNTSYIKAVQEGDSLRIRARCDWRLSILHGVICLRDGACVATAEAHHKIDDTRTCE